MKNKWLIIGRLRGVSYEGLNVVQLPESGVQELVVTHFALVERPGGHYADAPVTRGDAVPLLLASRFCANQANFGSTLQIHSMNTCCEVDNWFHFVWISSDAFLFGQFSIIRRESQTSVQAFGVDVKHSETGVESRTQHVLAFTAVEADPRRRLHMALPLVQNSCAAVSDVKAPDFQRVVRRIGHQKRLMFDECDADDRPVVDVSHLGLESLVFQIPNGQMSGRRGRRHQRRAIAPEG